MAEPTEQQRQRRAGASLAAVGLGALVVLGLVAALLVSRSVTDDRTPSRQSSASSREHPRRTEQDFGWDLSAQKALATRPMMTLPVQAAQPQPMASPGAKPPPITLPDAPGRQDSWIPKGFANTPAGVLARLAALNEAAMRGGDPATYARGYRELSLPGAPDPRGTGLFSLLKSMRSSAGLPMTGPVADLRVTYEVTHGQIKGTTDGGRYVVGCVLGQLTVDYRGQVLTAGAGDCQALRRVNGSWHISPGALPAPAPNAWPGSRDCVAAGYRELI